MNLHGYKKLKSYFFLDNKRQIYNEKIINLRMVYNDQAEHILFFYDHVYFYKKILYGVCFLDIKFEKLNFFFVITKNTLIKYVVLLFSFVLRPRYITREFVIISIVHS